MGKFRNKSVEYLSKNTWIFTEKIDGTNIRVHWDGHKVEFGGRTDRSNIPASLVNVLNQMFGGQENEELFEQKFGDSDVILFGEGYGSKIQKGELYRNDVSFILFDVMVNGVYLERENIEDIAAAFAIDAVPVIGEGTLEDGVNIVLKKPMSTIGSAQMEGIVAKPKIEIRDRLGHRIIVKIKVKDFDTKG